MVNVLCFGQLSVYLEWCCSEDGIVVGEIPKGTLGLRTGPRNLEEGEVELEAGLRMRVFDWRVLVPLTGVKGAAGTIFPFGPSLVWFACC